MIFVSWLYIQYICWHLISSSGLSLDSVGFLCLQMTFCPFSVYLYSLFCFVLFFSCIIALARISSSTLKSNDVSEVLHLFPALKLINILSINIYIHSKILVYRLHQILQTLLFPFMATYFDRFYNFEWSLHFQSKSTFHYTLLNTLLDLVS